MGWVLDLGLILLRKKQKIKEIIERWSEGENRLRQELGHGGREA